MVALLVALVILSGLALRRHQLNRARFRSYPLDKWDHLRIAQANAKRHQRAARNRGDTKQAAFYRSIKRVLPFIYRDTSNT